MGRPLCGKTVLTSPDKLSTHGRNPDNILHGRLSIHSIIDAWPFKETRKYLQTNIILVVETDRQTDRQTDRDGQTACFFYSSCPHPLTMATADSFLLLTLLSRRAPFPKIESARTNSFR